MWQGDDAQILKVLANQAPNVRKGEQQSHTVESGRKEPLVAPSLLVGCLLSDTKAGGPPMFPSGGYSLPRWSRSPARVPELHVLAEGWCPEHRRRGLGCQPGPGQTGSGTCALPGLAATPVPRVPEGQSLGIPAGHLSFVSWSLKVEEAVFRKNWPLGSSPQPRDTPGTMASAIGARSANQP